MRCINCKTKLTPTNDFFIWECKKCNYQYILQCTILKNKEEKLNGNIKKLNLIKLRRKGCLSLKK